MLTLKEALGESQVNDRYIERLAHSHDLAPVPRFVARNYNNMPDAVVKPRTTDDLVKLVRLAAEQGTPLAPKGRGTSYLWGSVPVTGGIVVDMLEFRQFMEISIDNLWVEVCPGFTWEEVELSLNKDGHTLCVYPTSMPSATIGGWIAASGAGLGKGGYGVGSVMYGAVGANVAYMEVVNGKGEKLCLSSKKDISDFIGTDGITGIISKVRLKIRKIAPARAATLFSVSGPDELGKMVSLFQAGSTAYFGQFEDTRLLSVKQGAGLHTPAGVEGYTLLAVFEGPQSEVEKDTAQIRKLAASLGCAELPGDEAETEWEERFYPMRVKRGGPTVVAGEFTAPAAALPQVVRDVARQLPGKPAKGGLHGIVVGGQEVIIMPQVFTDERKGFGFLAALSYSKRFNDIGIKNGGKPYGVGHLNAFSAAAVHGREGLGRLKNLKKRHDPSDIMNPGKVIRHMTKYGVPAPAFVFSLTMRVLGFFRSAGL